MNEKPITQSVAQFTAPEPAEILAAIADVPAKYDGQSHTIAEWRALYRKDLATARQQSAIAIFNKFVNCLLERAMWGESAARRATEMEWFFTTFERVTEDTARDVLSRSGYRWGPEKGAAVIIGAMAVVVAEGFTWQEYVDRAEDHYDLDFPGDDFLKIKHVSFKTRDLALSELSDRFIPIDLHIARIVSRTGLFLHGYGDPMITTEVTKKPGYLFFHGLMLKLARKTGWPEAGYSPGEIDRMLWHFGRAVCKATPRCHVCPLATICLTSIAQRAVGK